MKRRSIIVVCLRLGAHMPERIRNFQACLESLNSQTVARERYEIWVCEEGIRPFSESAVEPLWDEYVFRYSDSPFNRSRALNEGARASEARPKDLLCLMDADLLVDWKWIHRMYQWVMKYPAAVLPYQNVMYLDKDSTDYVIDARKEGYIDFTRLTAQRNSTQSVGGAFWIHAALYWHLGGHDEEYVGWGCEDSDFFFKVEKACRPTRLQGATLLHLHHPSVPHQDDPDYVKNRKRFEERNRQRLDTLGGVHRRTSLVKAEE